MREIQEGLIYTNENCVGCNKCISVCSCQGATLATISEDGKNIIKIDGSKCIACGACFDACEHHAREYVDDTLSFFHDLQAGEEITILLAPAFFANYQKEAEEILGKLKALGVSRMLSVAFGADITTWAYLNYIAKHDFTGGISQPCPATVDYIEKYIPELIPKLMPVQSPMMCAAIYAKKQMGITGKIAFVGPCIAKKHEMESARGQGLISYNVTFDHMMQYLRTKEIAPVAYEMETAAGLGAVYPMPGGLAENIFWFLGEDAYVRQITGEKQMYQYLEQNKDRILAEDNPYALIDVLNCADGCLCGTGVEAGIEKEDVFLAMKRIREASKTDGPDGSAAWFKDLSPNERLSALNEQFKDLELADYLCSYTDRSAECAEKIPTEEELQSIFASMDKTTEESQCINCSCCGYASCKEMATAIYNGINHRENCIYYSRVEWEVAEQANRAKSSFLANMSHEIRTPINAILGMDTMILRESNQESVLEYAQNVRSASNTLLALINDILDFSKIESGKMEIVEGQYRLDSVVNDLMNMVDGKARDKGLSLLLEIQPETPAQLIGDEIRVKQVILNILNNAVKYTKTGTVTLKIGYEEVDDTKMYLCVAVTDTGIGIKKEDMDVLFSPYARLEENKNKYIEGTGLGLSITRNLLDKMGSALEVESVYGEGSTFSFRVSQGLWGNERMNPKQLGSKVEVEEEEQQLYFAPHARILVVDDVEMNIMVINNLLKRSEIRPDYCLSGAEAVDMAKEKKYDIIFLDAMMPGMNGEETLKAIRETSEVNQETPIIVLTADAIVGARDKYIAEGFTDYLSKPIDSHKLDRLVQQYLSDELLIEGSTLADKKEEEGQEHGASSKKLFRGGRHFLLFMIGLILISFAAQIWYVQLFNLKPVTLTMEDEMEKVEMAPYGGTGTGDHWETMLQMSENPEDMKVFVGETCGINVTNHQVFAISNWTLREDIVDECYLNGFWCGTYEIHQFRHGKEIVELVDPKKYSQGTTLLDHNPYSSDMMIHLMPGDYLIYHPSEEIGEHVVGTNGAIGIGMIFYYEDTLDLSQNQMTYYNNRRVRDGYFILIWFLLILIWFVATVVHVSSIVTYKRTKREVDAVTNSVITGLSREYKTLWLINVQEQTIQLVQNIQEAPVKNAIHIANRFEDYNESLKYYIDHYVDASDRERVWNAVELEALTKHLEKEDFFVINYLHHEENQGAYYYQMAFTRAGGADGNNIVLAYRDVDHFVREERSKKRQLEEALAQAEEASKSKSMFLANVSHEIRTPINAIIGMNTMVMRESTEESIRAYASNIQNASDELLKLVDEILAYSSLEVASEQTGTAGAQGSVAPEAFHAPSADILVVDDVEMNLIVMKSLLKRLEILPQTCLSGETALSMASKQKFDLIILDAMMPGLSGEETLQKIKETCPLNQDTPMVVLTANAIVGAKEHYLSVGFSEYLSKPIDGDALEAVIQRYLPEEKMILRGQVGFETKKEEVKEESDAVKALKQSPLLQVEEGIAAAGGEETYLNVCKNFYETAESRMQMLREHYEAEDFANYAIQAHALKSSARLVGALDLSALALAMEMAGKEEKADEIKAHTEELLAQYDSVQKALRSILDVMDDAAKEELSEKKLKRTLMELEEIIEAYDFETAKELLEALAEYQLPEDFEECYKKLKLAIAEVDYEAMQQAIEEYKK